MNPYKKTSTRRVRDVVPLILITATLAGCATFKASRHVDLLPFAESTISLISDITYGLNQQHAVHLRSYMKDPGVLAYNAGWDSLRPVLRGVAAYSLAIVTLSKSDLAEREKVDQLATFLERLLQPVDSEPQDGDTLSRDELSRVLANIRSQTKFLDGLGSAQPIIDMVARVSGSRLDRLQETATSAQERLLQQIEADHADVVTFSGELRRAETRTFRSMLTLGEYRATTDSQLIDRLRSNDPLLAQFLPESSRLSADEIQTVENRLTYRLTTFRQIREHLAADLETYNVKVRELDELGRAASSNLMRARATIWIWSRAHARLATGVTDPARVDIMGIAKSAMDAALPF